MPGNKESLTKMAEVKNVAPAAARLVGTSSTRAFIGPLIRSVQTLYFGSARLLASCLECDY